MLKIPFKKQHKKIVGWGIQIFQIKSYSIFNIHEYFYTFKIQRLASKNLQINHFTKKKKVTRS
jgi:hypothetical protein